MPKSSRSSDTDTPPTYRFGGFLAPNTTPVPDVIFDEIITEIDNAELRVLLYIVRRTYGFKKQNEGDAISLSQMVTGIKRRDGQILDRGVGLSKPSVARALRGLRSKGIIKAFRSSDAERGNKPTIYRLRAQGEPIDNVDGDNSSEIEGITSETPLVSLVRQGVSQERDTSLSQSRNKPLSHQRDTQQTVEQQTVEQDFESSKIRKTTKQDKPDRRESPTRDATLPSQQTPEEVRARIRAKLARARKAGGDAGFNCVGEMIENPEPDEGQSTGHTYDEARQVLVSYMTDYARELGDTAPLQSTVSRAYNLMQRSGLDLDTFISKLYEARAKTQERTATITTRGEQKDPWGQVRKTKMPYFFSVLEDILGLKSSRSIGDQRIVEPTDRGAL